MRLPGESRSEAGMSGAYGVEPVLVSGSTTRGGGHVATPLGLAGTAEPETSAQRARRARIIQATLALAKELRIEFVWLPKQWPELNAMDQVWKELKRDVAANRQAASIEDLADRASQWVLNLTPAQARRKSGMASSNFWLRSLSQHIWLPTTAVSLPG